MNTLDNGSGGGAGLGGRAGGLSMSSLEEIAGLIGALGRRLAGQVVAEALNLARSFQYARGA